MQLMFSLKRKLTAGMIAAAFTASIEAVLVPFLVPLLESSGIIHLHTPCYDAGMLQMVRLIYSTSTLFIFDKVDGGGQGP